MLSTPIRTAESTTWSSFRLSEYLQICSRETRTLGAFYSEQSIMSEKRLGLVKSTFAGLANGAEAIPLEDLEQIYNAKGHPRVRSREKSEETVLLEFKEAIRKKSADGNLINEKEFLDYFADVSSVLPTEKEGYFQDVRSSLFLNSFKSMSSFRTLSISLLNFLL